MIKSDYSYMYKKRYDDLMRFHKLNPRWSTHDPDSYESYITAIWTRIWLLWID